MTKTATILMVAVICGCGGGGGGGGGDDTSPHAEFLVTCNDARDWKESLGCSRDPQDLCGRDVQWLELTGDACYDELLGWWECLSTENECAGPCDPSPPVDCVAAYCTANASNEACTSCLEGCPPPPPP